MSSPHFLLLGRPDCALCEEMLAALQALPEAQGIGIQVVDVDSRPDAQARYGHKIPVLFYSDELICHGRLNAEEVSKTLKLHARHP